MNVRDLICLLIKSHLQCYYNKCYYISITAGLRCVVVAPLLVNTFETETCSGFLKLCQKYNKWM